MHASIAAVIRRAAVQRERTASVSFLSRRTSRPTPPRGGTHRLVPSHGVVVCSLVPTDVPQLIQRPSDAVLLERQFHSFPEFDQFNVNDEVRLLLNGFRELPKDLQLSYNVILVLSLIVMFVAFEGVELIREWNSNSQYVGELEKTKKKKKGAPTMGRPAVDGEEEDEMLRELRERRRGLGWLALITSIAVWATGVVNTSNPFGS